LEYLQKVYPSYEVKDDAGNAKEILDFVEKDIVRVQDPMMYGNSPQIVPGTHWTEDMRGQVVAACQQLNNLPAKGAK
jgi:hypothetical protein